MMVVYRDSLLAATPTPLRRRLARMRGAGTPLQPLPEEPSGQGRMVELVCTASQYDLSDSFIATGEDCSLHAALRASGSLIWLGSCQCMLYS